MSKRQMIMLLGFLIIIFPFLGFDSSTKTIISIVIGLSTITVAYRAKPSLVEEIKIQNDKENKSKDLPYVESIIDNSKNVNEGK